MKDKKPLTIEQRIRRLRKPRSLNLRRMIDVPVLEHALKMMRASESKIGFKVLAAHRTKWAAVVYNCLVIEEISTQDQLDQWFLEALRERAALEGVSEP